ncbi:LCP family protein [Streptomyces sp. NPDC058284]|uniref:LCP family protein n=1 Tax=unclassified Streptomyces TaxID=2593676 RepID=UPI0036533124
MGGVRRRRGRAQRRGRGRKWRVGLAVVGALVVLGVGGGGWVYLKLNGSIETFDADGISGDRPAAGGSGGQNVLVIGSDARTGGNRALGGGDSDDIGRSDTAFLLHVYADRRHAVAVSIPRDALVDIPSCKLPDGKWTEPQHHVMFNAAYSVGETAKGNPACTQNTVEKLSGLRVDHTVVVDFKGFSELTDVVGGVEVCLPKDLYEGDLNPRRGSPGRRIFRKGVQEVSGQRALDYVRIRHGIGDGSDIGRIKRQQAFVSGLLKKIKSEGFSPGKLFPLADAAVHSMTVDPGLGSADKLISFAMSLKDIDLHNTKFVTLPWRYDGARVAVVEPEASQLWAALREDKGVDGGEKQSRRESEEVSGGGIAVHVLNGTSVDGLAAKAARSLTSHGFTVTGTGTAAGQEHVTTVVEYGTGKGKGKGEGLKARAENVARLFPGAEVRARAAAEGGGVRVVLGRSYAERSGAEAGSADSTGSGDSAGSMGSAGSTSGAGSMGGAGGGDRRGKARAADAGPCSDLSYG